MKLYGVSEEAQPDPIKGRELVRFYLAYSDWEVMP